MDTKLMEKEQKPRLNQYFEKYPTCRSEPKEIQVELAGRPARVKTDSGVFSASGLDKGTRVLLSALPVPKDGADVLDLGSGWGAISIWAGMKNPSCKIWALEINERAKGLCRQNFKALGIENASMVGENERDLKFDYIFSNPPVRIGKDALKGLLSSWLRRLKGGGGAYLVISRHLGSDSMMKWMEGEGWKVEKIKSSKGYRVIKVCRG